MTKTEREKTALLIACKAAIAALSQNKTFPADIAFAKNALKHAMQDDDNRHCHITKMLDPIQAKDNADFQHKPVAKKEVN